MAGPRETRKVEAIRQFRHRGQSIGVGSIIEDEARTCAELVVNGKARGVDPASKVVVKDLAPPELEARFAERRARAGGMNGSGPSPADVEAMVEAGIRDRLPDAVAEAIEAELPGAVAAALAKADTAKPAKDAK